VASEATARAETSASARLRRKVEVAATPFAVAAETLMRHPRIRELWPRYLVSTHTIIRTTVPLMETAVARARELGDGDPVAVGAAEYFEQHAEEERDHDAWLLDDLELLGIPREDVVRRVPSPTVARLVGQQYYWALHYHPATLLGYFAVMEGFPPQPELVEELIERTGYTRESFRTFAEHGELDPHHREELDEAIDGLPLAPEQEAAIGVSAIATCDLLAQSLREVLEELPAAS
jgi:Iron-containing redox enzyme